MKNKKVSAAKVAYERARKEHEGGEGSRFKAMEKMMKAEGARDPGAMAAAAGRKKYGKARMAMMAAAGRK